MADRRDTADPLGGRARTNTGSNLLAARLALSGNLDEDSIAQPMHYGDQIALWDNDHLGFATCDRSGSPYETMTVEPGGSKTASVAGNFQTCVFEVYPQNKYRANKKLLAAINRVKKPGEKFITTAAAIERDAGIAPLRTLADSEREDNRLERRRRHGDPVLYGQVVLLHHTVSDKFVRISTSRTSPLEPSNLDVDIGTDPDRHSWFRIMPRYKVRAEGDPVRVNDQIVFESIMTPGQFLHTSLQKFDSNSAHGGLYEINLSVAQTSFSVIDHRHFDEPTDMLHAGGTIQLFHKEIAAYLAAEGIWCQDEPTNGAHLRVRLPDSRRPSRLVPPTSAVSMWQVELARAPVSGRTLKWEEVVRLKHLTTQRYLTVVSGEDGAWVPVLTRTLTGKSGDFRLNPVVREMDEIQYESYARIQHVSTGLWMHGDGSLEYTRCKRDLHTSGTPSDLQTACDAIVWDHAPLAQLGFTKARMFDDAFIIQRVPEETVQNVSFVSGIVHVLLFYIRTRAKRELNDKECDKVVEALEELAHFMFLRGAPVRQRQKLLRNLQIVEMLVDVLRAPFAPFNATESAVTLEDLKLAQHKLTLRVSDAAYRVLEVFLVGDSRKNELYIAAHIPFFQSQVGGVVHVEKMYTELVKDNPIVVHSITDTEMLQFVQLLRHDKDGDYLDFLSVLCEVDGGPVPSNQEKVCRMLLQESKNAVYLTELDPDRREVMVNLTGQPDAWMPLRKFAESAMDEDDSTSTKTYLFLQKQLDLFGKLCAGRNQFARRIIVDELKYLTWAECFHCMTDTQLPKSLRAKYVELCVNIFIDEGDNNDVLSHPTLVFPWEELTANPYADAAEDRTTSLSGSRMPFFIHLHDWIIGYLATQGDVVAADKPGNRLLAAVLRLLNKLIEFGFYAHPDDIMALMQPLSSVADGRNDRQFPQRPAGKSVQFKKTMSDEKWRRRGRFEVNSENTQVVDVKLAALNCIDQLTNLCDNVRLQHILFDFKVTLDGLGTTFERRRASTLRKGRVSHADPSYTPSGKYLSMLQHLAQLPEGDEEGLFRLTQPVRQYVQHTMQRSNWITPGWHSSGPGGSRRPHQLVEAVMDLANYDYPALLTRSLGVYNRCFTARTDLFENCVAAQVLLTKESLTLEQRLSKYVPALRRLSLGFIEAKELQPFLEITGFLEHQCYMVPSDPQSSPHNINQGIIFNTGVAHTLFDVAQKGMGSGSQLPEVLRGVYSCLRAMCRAYPPVQQLLFDVMDVWLDARNLRVPGYQNELAGMVGEVFTNNHKLCLAVRTSHVHGIMNMLSHCKTTAPNVLTALRAVLKVEELDLPLQRNQSIVMKSLIEHREQVIAPAHIDDESNPVINERRLALLRGEGGTTTGLVTSYGFDGEDGPPEGDERLREYHCQLVDLLAACAEGENRYIEFMCQTIFSIQEIIEVLVSPNIGILAKGSYLRFFLWVYLNTGESSPALLSANLTHDNQLWSALAHLFEDRIVTGSDPLSAAELDFMFGSLLPFVSKFATGFYNKGFQWCQRSLRGIGLGVGAFITNQLSRIQERPQLKMLSRCAMSIGSLEPGAVSSAAMDLIQSRLQGSDAGIVDTPLIARYKKLYATENSLNHQFNRFAQRLLKAYGGANRISVQLIHFTGSEVAEGRVYGQVLDNRMYCEPEGDDEALPLSPDFQMQLEQFIEVRTDHETNERRKYVRRERISCLVRMLAASINFTSSRSSREQSLQSLLDQRVLQVIRALLHNDIRTGVDVTDLQSQLADTVLSVAFMLQDEDDEVVREALATLSTLLQDGNKAVQQAFERYFLGTREERFFDAVQDRIRRSITSTRELRLLKLQMQEQHDRNAALMGTFTMASKMAGRVQATLAMAEDDGSPPGEDERSGKSIRLRPMSHDSSAERGTSTDDIELGAKDEGNIELVLRVLQNMCEGHNTVLKSYLQTQPDNIRSIDLVARTVEFLEAAAEEIVEETVELVIQTLETLVEFAQGHVVNQSVIFDNHAVDTINLILRTPEYPCPDPTVARLKMAAGKLIAAMLEFNGEATAQMARELEETLDLFAIIKTMNEYWDVHKSEADQEWEGIFGDEEVELTALEVSYLMYSIVMRLRDFSGKDYFRLQQYNKDTSHEDETHDSKVSAKARRCDNPVADAIDKYSVSIEIVKDGELHKVHFFNHWRQQLRETTKHNVMWTVDRSSPNDKIRDFVDMSKTIVADVEYQERVRNNPITFVLTHYANFYGNLLLLISFAINILILVNWKAGPYWDERLPVFRYGWFDLVLLVMGIVQVVVACVVAIGYQLMHPPALRASLESLPGVAALKGAIYGEELSKSSGSAGEEEEDPYTQRTEHSLLSVMSIHHMLLVLFSALGLLYDGYFYCYHLFHVIVNNEILERVIHAVTKNGKSLLWVAALMVIVIYTYSFTQFAFLREYMDQYEGQWCNTLWECFVTSMKFGFLSTLSDASRVEVQRFWIFELQALYDLSFFIIITTIGLNLVFGIIVDTFSELRDEKYAIEEQMKSECFICSLKNYDFERFGNGFVWHIKKEHHLWNYFFFILHLRNKDPSDYTSLEYYVADLVAKKNETQFFPINRAIVLQEHEDKERGVEERMDEQDATLQSLSHRLDFLIERMTSN